MGIQKYNKQEKKQAGSKHRKLHTPAPLSVKKVVVGRGKKAKGKK